MEDRPDGLATVGRLVGVADLAEDLPLAEHQALQAGGDAEQVADGRLVVVGDQVRRRQLPGRLVEVGQEVGQVGDPGHRRRVGRAAYSSTRLQVERTTNSTPGKAASERVEPLVAARAFEGQGLADRGRRGVVVDPHGQQPHGPLPVAPARLGGTPWAVGKSRSTPTQVKIRNAKATTVSSITRRPRIAAETGRAARPRRTAHKPTALRTFGSFQPIAVVPPRSGRRDQHQADQEAGRQEREGQR